MLEILLAALAVAALAALSFVPWPWLLQAGALLTLAGLAAGLPPALVYHVRLRAALGRGGRPPRRWWLEPSRHHRRLAERDRRRVMPWFVTGGAGFVAALAGCGLVLLGVLGSLASASGP